MELRHLRAFIAVAEEGSFTRAADRLVVVQSAVSAAVRGLERELGVPLFDRTTRRVALNDAGRALLPEARATLAAAELAADAVAQVRGGVRGSVVLGIMQAAVGGAVSPARLIAHFSAEHPLVEVSVRHVGGSQRLAEQVRDGGLDLAILSLPDRHVPGLQLTPLASEPVLLACPANHRLAGRASVELGELRDEGFVDGPPGWGIRLAADRAFALAGQTRRLRYEVNDTASIAEFVSVGLAVALLPASMAAHAPDVVMVPLRGRAIAFPTLLAEPAQRRATAAVGAFAAAVRAAAQTQGVAPAASDGPTIPA